MDYVKFLSGECKDDKGRMVTDILKYNKVKLETIHNYIQEMFPTTEQSQFSKIQPISLREVDELRKNKTALLNIHKMYEKMLSFWGIDGDKYLSGYEKLLPFRIWNHNNNHNQWRMTRVLKSLKLLEMDMEFIDFSRRIRHILLLRQEGNAHIHISDETAEIWRTNL